MLRENEQCVSLDFFGRVELNSIAISNRVACYIYRQSAHIESLKSNEEPNASRRKKG